MSTLRFSSRSPIPAPPDRVFGLLADYRGGHRGILPPRYFTGLEVEEGGYGAGTVIRFGMRAMGRTRTARAAVTEPVPGRVLVETDLGSAFVTTFTVSPLGTDRSELEIATDMTTRGGIIGLIQRAVTRAYLKRVYAEQLRLIAARVTAAPEAP